MCEEQTSLPLSSCVEGFHVRTPAWPELAAAYLESVQGCGPISPVSFLKSLPVGFSSRMSLEFCERGEAGIWEPSSGTWGTGGMGGPGVCWRLTVSEFPTGAIGCSLSAVLEGSVPPRFYMSRNALDGMLRRATERRVGLHPELEDRLRPSDSTPDRTP